MEALDYWKLCDRVSVFQAIMLFLGFDPQDETSYGMERNSSPPVGYLATKTAFIEAIKDGKIGGDIFPECSIGIELEAEKIPGTVNIDDTKVYVKSVRDFLATRGVSQGFYFPQTEPVVSDYLNRSNLAYAPKLAAAVNAWLAVAGNEDALRGRTPKQALEKWLRQHANEYGLTKDDGNPNDDGIEQICKVANWKPEGGAAKTPTQVSGTHPPTKKHKK